MSARVDKTLRGIGVQSPHLVFANLEAQGVGSTDSDYSESTPRPGRATTADTAVRLEPSLTGGQVEGIDLMVRRTGLPERRGLEVMYRLATETDDRAWRGHNPPGKVDAWIAAVWDETDAHEVFALATTREDQQLVLVYVEEGGVGELKSRTFDFVTNAWDSEVTVSVGLDSGSADITDTWVWVGAVALPGGRVLCIAPGGHPDNTWVYSAWASSDAGATWEPYALPGQALGGVDGFTASVDTGAVAYDRGDIVLLLADSGSEIHQWASADLGASFDEVGSSGAAVGYFVRASAMPEGLGGVVVSYLRDADDYPCTRTLAAANNPFSDVAEVVIDSVACSDLTVSVDEVGNVWAFVTTTAARGTIRVYVSEDGGNTFVRCEDAWSSADAATYTRNFQAAWARGWLVLAHAWTTDTTTNPQGSIGTLWTSGWSNLLANGYAAGQVHSGRQTWAGGTFGNYLPIELPSALAGWGLTGTPTLNTGALQFGTGVSIATFTLGSGDPVLAIVDVELSSGSGASATNDVVTQIHVADNLTLYSMMCRLDAANSRVRVLDPNGTMEVDVTIDVDEPFQMLLYIGPNGVFPWAMWWRRPWDTLWTLGADYDTDGTMLVDGGAGLPTSRLQFGHATGAVNVSRWRLAAVRDAELRVTGVQDVPFGIGAEYGNSVAPTPSEFGGQITTQPRALPDVGSESAAAFLSARRGPGVIGEEFGILPDYDFGVHHLFADLSPSPARPWRSADLTEQLIVFDLGANNTQNIGSMWQYAMVLRNTNIRTAYLQRWTGAAWSTVITYDAATGFSALGYERAGAYIRPTTSSAAGGRFIGRNELAGGFALLDNGGTVYARRIVSNSPGTWRDPAAVGPTLWPEVELEGITGAEPGSGSVTLVWPDGCALATASGTVIAGRQPDSTARYWRLRIPVQDVVDAYYQIGAFVPCTVAGLGKQWSRGFSKDSEPNASLAVSRRGTRRKRQRGPVGDRWVLSWQDGVLDTFQEQAVPTYLGHADVVPTLYPAIATRDDVWRLLRGLLRETEGGSAAVVVIDEVELGPTTITDRTRWIYGTWDSSVQANQVEEGFHRIDPITVHEQV